jgi:HK97 family phage major capsid protein
LLACLKGREPTMADSALERLVEKQNKIWARMQELQTRSESEQGWSDEDRSNWDEAEKDLTTVSADIERFQRSAKLERIDYTQVPETRAPGDTLETPEQVGEKRALEYQSAFGNYMRGGLERCNTEQRDMLVANFDSIEQRAQGTATSAAGGYLVPPGFRDVLVQTMKAYGGLMNYANIINTSTGNPLQWPTVNDTGNVGAILAENTQITQQDVVFGTRTIGAYVYTSLAVLVSLQLLQDSAFNIDQKLPELLGERLGRATAAHFISGTGSSQPEGVATNATIGKTGATGQTLTVTYDDLIDLEHSVDPAYRNSATCRWLMNDATFKVVRKIKDTTGRPIWLPIPTPGFPATINGYPYVIDQGMPLPGANNKSIIFGDFNKGYLIRQVQGVQMVRLAERYADYLQVGFFGYTRLDARPDDPAAIRAYAHSAT